MVILAPAQNEKETFIKSAYSWFCSEYKLSDLKHWNVKYNFCLICFYINTYIMQ